MEVNDPVFDLPGMVEDMPGLCGGQSRGPTSAFRRAGPAPPPPHVRRVRGHPAPLGRVCSKSQPGGPRSRFWAASRPAAPGSPSADPRTWSMTPSKLRPPPRGPFAQFLPRCPPLGSLVKSLPAGFQYILQSKQFSLVHRLRVGRWRKIRRAKVGRRVACQPLDYLKGWRRPSTLGCSSRRARSPACSEGLDRIRPEARQPHCAAAAPARPVDFPGKSSLDPTSR